MLQKQPGAGIAKRLIGSVVCAVIVCGYSTSIIYAQSPRGETETRRWFESKRNDKRVTGRLRAINPNGHDPCDPRNLSGPYNPFPCFEKQLEGLRVFAEISKDDPGASSSVRRNIQQSIEGLTLLKRQWDALPESTRKQRLEERAALLKAVRDADNDVERGLRKVKDDPNVSTSLQSLAGNLLGGCKTTNSLGTMSDVRSCFGCWLGCLCVKPDGCRCCDLELPFDFPYRNLRSRS